MKKVSFIFITLLILGISAAGSGCMGYFSGYDDKAKQITSAEYAVKEYQGCIGDYNHARLMGVSIVNAQKSMEEFQKTYKNPEFYTTTQMDHMESLRKEESNFIRIYNADVTKYNNRMRDITRNQVWMIPQNFPNELQPYVKGQVLTSENSEELVLPNEIPQAPPGWVPPSQQNK